MPCPCGYYSTCTEGCTPERRLQILRSYEYWRQLITEEQKDSDEAKEERHS